MKTFDGFMFSKARIHFSPSCYIVLNYVLGFGSIKQDVFWKHHVLMDTVIVGVLFAIFWQLFGEFISDWLGYLQL